MLITVKQARIGANLTQAGIASKMGIHPQTYMRLEKHPGKMTVQRAIKFAKIVGVPFDNIFFGD